MFMMFLGQVLDFFKDLILGSTIPLILGTLTGLIISIFLFVFINKFLMPKIYLWIKIPFGVIMILCMMTGGSIIGCWTSVIYPVKRIFNVTFGTAEKLAITQVNAMYAWPKQKMDELIPNEKIGEVFDTVYSVSKSTISDAKMPAKLKNVMIEHIDDVDVLETVGSSANYIKTTVNGTIHTAIWTVHKFLYNAVKVIYIKVLIALWIMMITTIVLFILTEYLNFAFFAGCKKLVKMNKEKKRAKKEQEKLETNKEVSTKECPAVEPVEIKKEEPEKTPLKIEYKSKDLVSEAVDRSWNAATTVNEVSTAELIDRHNRTTAQ